MIFAGVCCFGSSTAAEGETWYVTAFSLFATLTLEIYYFISILLLFSLIFADKWLSIMTRLWIRTKDEYIDNSEQFNKSNNAWFSWIHYWTKKITLQIGFYTEFRACFFG